MSYEIIQTNANNVINEIFDIYIDFIDYKRQSRNPERPGVVSWLQVS